MSESASLHALRFPIGTFEPTANPDNALQKQWLNTIAEFPMRLRTMVEGLSAAQLNMTYRPGGWNIKQLVHHCADSHMNAYLRFKLTLTEDEPTIKPYNEAAWAECLDGQSAELSSSLTILEGLHYRWVDCMKSMKDTDWKRVYRHPEHGQLFSLLLALDNYDWHCRHHLAHVRLCLERGN